MTLLSDWDMAPMMKRKSAGMNRAFSAGEFFLRCPEALPQASMNIAPLALNTCRERRKVAQGSRLRCPQRQPQRLPTLISSIRERRHRIPQDPQVMDSSIRARRRLPTSRNEARDAAKVIVDLVERSNRLQ